MFPNYFFRWNGKTYGVEGLEKDGFVWVQDPESPLGGRILEVSHFDEGVCDVYEDHGPMTWENAQTMCDHPVEQAVEYID